MTAALAIAGIGIAYAEFTVFSSVLVCRRCWRCNRGQIHLREGRMVNSQEKKKSEKLNLSFEETEAKSVLVLIPEQDGGELGD